MEAWRQWLLGGRKLFSATNNQTHYEPRIPLTPTGLLMEGDYTLVPCLHPTWLRGSFPKTPTQDQANFDAKNHSTDCDATRKASPDSRNESRDAKCQSHKEPEGCADTKTQP
jgi:hypothetical protein